MSNAVDGVREVSRSEADLLHTRGLIADLSRDSVTVHVGKPVGSLTGYVGPIFFQVWTDARDEPGAVHARVETAEPETWQFDAALSKDAILAQAKDRLVEQIQADRLARLDAAKARLASLTA